MNSSPYITLEEVKAPLSNKGTVTAELVVNKESGFQERKGRTGICQFHPHLKGDRVNNPILFLNPEKKYVTSGQVGSYSPENGLRVKML